jgi:hypothetical protein
LRKYLTSLVADPGACTLALVMKSVASGAFRTNNLYPHILKCFDYKNVDDMAQLVWNGKGETDYECHVQLSVGPFQIWTS